MRCALLIALVLPALTGCRPVDAGARIVDVATTTAQGGWAVNYPKQRKVLFMAGRLWVFYADGSQLWARTTADGLTLSDPVLVRDDAGYGHRCAFAFDGTWLHSACCVATDGADVFYRRGTPGADGSLAWDGPPQTAFDVPDGQSVLYPKVLVDAAGRPWVAFMLFEAGFMQAPQRAWVSRSERSDGTWATAPGFPFALSDQSTQTYPDPLGVALASGGVYWVWDPDGDSRYTGREWREDSGWQASELVSSAAHRHGLFDAVAIGDDVYVSYGGGQVFVRHRGADRRWGPERLVTSSGSGHTSISALGEGRVLVTWLDLAARLIAQREVTESTMGDALLMVNAGDDGLTGELRINLNGLPAAAGPFTSAITATLGQTAPYRVVLSTR